jgi:hypothetical protein
LKLLKQCDILFFFKNISLFNKVPTFKKKTERQKDRKTERQKDRKTERQKDRKTERQEDGKTERQKDKKTERQKDRNSFIMLQIMNTF